MNWTKELKCQQCDYPIKFQIFSSVKINYAEETTLNSDTKTGKIEKYREDEKTWLLPAFWNPLTF